jgi:hypothetical protein
VLVCEFGVGKDGNNQENWLNVSGFEPDAYRNYVCYRYTNLPSLKDRPMYETALVNHFFQRNATVVSLYTVVEQYFYCCQKYKRDYVFM